MQTVTEFELGNSVSQKKTLSVSRPFSILQWEILEHLNYNLCFSFTCKLYYNRSIPAE